MSPGEIVKELGWPENVPCSKGMLVWKLAPNDETITARLILDGARVLVSIVLRYIGREVTMLKAIFNGSSWEVGGVIGYAEESFDKLRENFLLHIEGMGSSPLYIEDAEVLA